MLREAGSLVEPASERERIPVRELLDSIMKQSACESCRLDWDQEQQYFIYGDRARLQEALHKLFTLFHVQRVVVAGVSAQEEVVFTLTGNSVYKLEEGCGGRESYPSLTEFFYVACNIDAFIPPFIDAVVWAQGGTLTLLFLIPI